MDSAPRVTVGVPTYNRASHLKETLRLILDQSYRDFEVIVSDDCSLDNTEQVVRAFSDPRIRFHRNTQNMNIPGNLNQVLDLARGEFIVMLHDHDIFHPQLLERMVSFLDQSPEVGFVHTGTAWIDPDGSNYTDVSPDFAPVTRGEELARRILLGSSFSSPINACGMVRRSAYEKVGFSYDTQFGFLSDVDMWLRIAAVYSVGYIRAPLITCRGRDADHPYTGPNWQLVEWILDIHRINIHRFFSANQSALQQALKHWRKKAGRYCLQNLAAAAASGDRQAFEKGLEYIASKQLPRLSALSRFMQSKVKAQRLLIAVTMYANYLRRLTSLTGLKS